MNVGTLKTLSYLTSFGLLGGIGYIGYDYYENGQNVSYFSVARASDVLNGVRPPDPPMRAALDYKSDITPAIVDRGAVVVAISSGGAAPVLARKLREKIELMLPAGISTLANLESVLTSCSSTQELTLYFVDHGWEENSEGQFRVNEGMENILSAGHLDTLLDGLQSGTSMSQKASSQLPCVRTKEPADPREVLLPPPQPQQGGGSKASQSESGGLRDGRQPKACQ